MAVVAAAVVLRVFIVSFVLIHCPCVTFVLV